MVTRSEREEKKRKRNNILMSVFLAFIMIVGILGFAVPQNNSSDTSALEYNGYKFTAGRISNGQVLLFTKINGTQVGFYFDPQTLEEINASQNFRRTMAGSSAVAFSLDAVNIKDATQDRNYMDLLIRDFTQFSKKTVEEGVLEQDIFAEKPKITCADASMVKPVIILTSSDAPLKIVDDTTNMFCYRLSGSDAEIIKARDYLIYLARGVMN